jgi:hypothetical protein
MAYDHPFRFGQVAAVDDVLTGVAIAVSATMDAGMVSCRQMEDDSAQLRQLLQEIRASAEDRSLIREHTPHFVKLLSELQRRLVIHFAWEVANDFFSNEVDIAMELIGLAEVLHSERHALTTEIESLVDQASALLANAANLEPRFSQLASRVRVFCYHLREHERSENALVAQAYGEDVGVGD